MTVADRPITTDIYGDEIELKPGDNYINHSKGCLLYTSDAADDMQCGDLGGRRMPAIIKHHSSN